MGLLDRLGLSATVRDIATGKLKLDRVPAYVGTSTTLNPIIATDLFGPDIIERLPLTRQAAIEVPAVSKARNLLVSTIAKWPLRAAARQNDADADATTKYPWLYRTDSAVNPYLRMAWTVDDEIFYGCSLWLTERGAAVDGRRPILDAEWCPPALWTITDGHVLVDEQEIDPDEYILIDSPFEGLLNIAQRTIRGARAIEDAWVGRAKNPIPAINLERDGTDDLTKEEVQELVNAWAAARMSPNGAIGSTPAGIKAVVLGNLVVELLIEGRNAVRTDIGSFLNVRAAMLDGTIGVDSLTYTTAEGERNAFYEFDTPFWTDPIAQRLSMDDVVPRGTRIRFDRYESLNSPSPLGPTEED